MKYFYLFMFQALMPFISKCGKSFLRFFFARSAWHKNGTGRDKSLLFNARPPFRNAQVVGSIPSVGSTLEGLRLLGCGPFLLLRWRWWFAAVCGSFWRVAAKVWHKNGTKRAA